MTIMRCTNEIPGLLALRVIQSIMVSWPGRSYGTILSRHARYNLLLIRY